MSADTLLLVENIRKEWSLALPEQLNEEDLVQLLGQRINVLIRSDLQRLIAILYRIDVDEVRLRSMLAQFKSVDAGLIIAALVLERQKQKQSTRQQFSRPSDEIPEDEKW